MVGLNHPSLCVTTRHRAVVKRRAERVRRQTCACRWTVVHQV